jgi:hypothetical protein
VSPSHPPWYDHFNILWSAQVTKLLIMQFSIVAIVWSIDIWIYLFIHRYYRYTAM